MNSDHASTLPPAAEQHGPNPGTCTHMPGLMSWLDAGSQASPLCELVHQDIWAVFQIKGPCQVVDCLGCLVSVAGALGGSVDCGQRLAGVPSEERVAVIRLHMAVETVGRAASKPVAISHEAKLLLCTRTLESTGSRAAKGECEQAAYEE